MLGYLIAKAWVKVAGISVVHSIPGRLRVHFTGGSKAMEFLQRQDTMPQKVFLYKLSGIGSFEFNPLTSRALIVYDPDKLNEGKIMTWLKRLQGLIIQRVIDGAGSVDQDAIDQIATQLKEEGYEMERFEQTTLA